MEESKVGVAVILFENPWLLGFTWYKIIWIITLFYNYISLINSLHLHIPQEKKFSKAIQVPCKVQ